MDTMKGGSKSKSKSDSEETSYAAEMKHQSWYLDSGCSCHMTGSKYMFQDRKLKDAGYVGVAVEMCKTKPLD